MSKNRGQSSGRAERRAPLHKERRFSNKKGVQLFITIFGGKLQKIKKNIQREKGKTIVHYKYE